VIISNLNPILQHLATIAHTGLQGHPRSSNTSVTDDNHDNSSTVTQVRSTKNWKQLSTRRTFFRHFLQCL